MSCFCPLVLWQWWDFHDDKIMAGVTLCGSWWIIWIVEEEDKVKQKMCAVIARSHFEYYFANLPTHWQSNTL